MAGDFYLIINMVILMIKIILHHGADDYRENGLACTNALRSPALERLSYLTQVCAVFFTHGQMTAHVAKRVRPL